MTEAKRVGLLGAMTRHEIFPLPVIGLFQHPLYVTLPVGAVGTLMRIIGHYWQSGCAPLPTNKSELFQISRAQSVTWHHNKDKILQIFKDIEPELKAYYDNRLNNKRALIETGNRGRGIAQLRRLDNKPRRNGHKLDPFEATARPDPSRAESAHKAGDGSGWAPTKKG